MENTPSFSVRCSTFYAKYVTGRVDDAIISHVALSAKRDYSHKFRFYNCDSVL